MTANIKSIKENIVYDITSPSGRRRIGFDTYYENSHFTHCNALFSKYSRELIFYTDDGCIQKVQIDKRIEELDVYHLQYGIPVADEKDVFFITSWYKGIYCCSLKTGDVLWNYKLKHATKIFLYDDYLVCAFQGIGLRKITYEGIEIEKYPITTYNSFFRLDEPYVFCGPKRGMYFVIDTRTMSNYLKIKNSIISPSGDPGYDSAILLELKGTCRDFVIKGFENEQRFEKRIQFLKK